MEQGRPIRSTLGQGGVRESVVYQVGGGGTLVLLRFQASKAVPIAEKEKDQEG